MSKQPDDDIPRGFNSTLRRFSAARQEESRATGRPLGLSASGAKLGASGGESERKPRKGLKAMSDRRKAKLAADRKSAPESSAADARNDGGRIVCPTCDYLDSLDLSEWVAFRRRQGAANPIWFTLETSHVFRQRWHDEPWARLRTCGGCHRFVHEKPVIGEAIGLLMLDKSGRFDRDAAFKALGRDPIGCLSNAVERGDFSGCPSLRSAAVALCGRFGG